MRTVCEDCVREDCVCEDCACVWEDCVHEWCVEVCEGESGYKNTNAVSVKLLQSPSSQHARMSCLELVRRSLYLVYQADLSLK